ncbi:MAG: YbaB/EbfC family nucleoid-associated protein [Acidobacteria bacterium]|nr:YbaB/EbfC family nucleoid-associated protein [Acidobacteriota bacterium]
MPNFQQMMNQVKKMQEEIQQQLEGLRVEASSGGGMVTVSMSGTKHVLSVKIDPEAVKSGDTEMLQDLFQAAVNEAMRQVDEALASKLGGLTGGLNLPGLTP